MPQSAVSVCSPTTGGALRKILGAVGLAAAMCVPHSVIAENMHFQLAPESYSGNKTGPAPLDAITNGRIAIRSVEIQGSPVLYPELGIRRDDVREILVRHIDKEQGQLTVSDMHRMADELTLFYREKGLSFAEFIVSPQEIISGELKINLLVGVLTEIHVRGNENYTTPQILSYFRNQMMAPVYTPDIEMALERLNRLPGLDVFGIFSVGRKQGEAILNLRAKEAPARETLVRLDNHGVENTGEFRAIVQHNEHNLMSSGGSLSVTVMTTDESSNLYGGLHYQQPVGLSSQFLASVSYNQFTVNGEFEALGLEGDLLDATLGWDYLPEHQPGFDSTLGLKVSARQATVSSDAFPQLLDSEYRYIHIAPSLDFVHTKSTWRLKQSLRLTPAYGALTDTENTEELDDYTLLRARYALRHQWLSDWPEFQISLTLEGQVTGDSLPPSERQSLSGPKAARGFDTGLYSADSYYRTSLMQTLYRLGTDSHWQLVPYVFTDYSDGRKENEIASEARFLSAGAGMEFAWGKTLQAGINWGYALDSEITPDPGPLESDSAVYGYLSTRF